MRRRGSRLKISGGDSVLFQKYTGGKFSLSLRDNNGYLGNVLKVSNDSGVELYFKYVDGVIDTAGILTHVGTGGGVISEWTGYDEFNNLVVFKQTAVSRRPIIAEAGAIVLLNGKPAVKFNNYTYLYHTGLNSYWTFIHNGTKNFMSIVASTTKTARGEVMGNLSSGSDNGLMCIIPLDNTNKVAILQGDGNGNKGSYNTATNTVVSGDQNVLVHHSDNGNATAAERSYLKLNGTLSKNNTVSGAPSTVDPSNSMGIGSRNGDTPSVPFEGKLQEINIWQNDLLAQIDNIETDINNYYA